ncbi:MAG: hypothetical protein LKI80_06175 [Sporolactobacillus sp.]|nr:hypothetical protein [Sporolactobacillus sp.]
MKKRYYRGEPLDLLHTVAFNQLYPLVSCLVTLSSPVDIERLQCAVERTSKHLPQVLCRYQPARNRWVTLPTRPNIITRLNDDDPLFQQPVDFLSGPQLKIFIQKQLLFIVMSHIFTDGAGFKQFLYLLADNYNSRELAPHSLNERSCTSVIHTLLSRGQKYKAEINLPNDALKLPFTTNTSTAKKYIDFVEIPKLSFQKIHQKAKHEHLTINDVIMAAYMAELARMTKQTKIALPCPIDLRPFLPSLSSAIANLTGEYGLAISIRRGDGLSSIAGKIHDQITSLSKERAFLQSIPTLLSIDHKLPVFLIRRIIAKYYHVQSVSYTNFGILDQRFHFDGKPILHCTLTGSFRKTPQFQLAVSTYRQVCTLSFCMIGSRLNRQEGHRLLQSVAFSLQKWSESGNCTAAQLTNH